jgi:integrase/recombinase XerC
MPSIPPPVGTDDPPVAPADPVALFLDDQQSPATRRAYAADLRSFFDGEPAPDAATAFFALSRARMARRLRSYKADLLARGVSEATVNRRLSTVRSLLKFAHARGLATCNGRGLVEGEKVRPPTGKASLPAPIMKRLLAAPGARTLRGRRDTAILHLLGENALRRAELCALDVADFSPEQRQVMLLDRGRDVPKQAVPLSRKAADSLAGYLTMAGHGSDPTAPLFRNLDHRPGVRGGRLTPDGVYLVVREYGRTVGSERLTPQQLRRSAITAALEGSSSVLRRVLRSFQSADDLYDAVRPEVAAPPSDRPAAPLAAFPAASAEVTEGRWRRVLRVSPRKEAIYYATRDGEAG